MAVYPLHAELPSPRNASWVLRQTAALTVMTLVGIVLLRFAYLLTAEINYARAAMAGANEATLPRASLASIQDVVRRRLGNGRSATDRVQILVTQNGTPVRGSVRPQPGDALSVAVTTSSRHVLPRWLERASGWLPESDLHVYAKQQFK